MPPKTYKKKYAKKSYRPKRRFVGKSKKVGSWNPNPPTSVTVRGLSRPDRLNVKLPYEEIISLGGSVFQDYVFRLNSLFDPNYSGTGHQPMGFDTWTPIYNRYLVHGAKVEAEFINNSGTSISIVGMVANNDASSLTATTSLEQSRGRNTMLSLNTGSRNSTKMRAYFSCPAVTGVTKAKYNSDDFYQSVVTTSPNETIALHCFSQDAGGVTNVATLIRVRIIYYATFFDPNPLAQS